MENARTFRGLYGVGVGSAAASLPKIGGLRGVVVPEMVEALCGEAVVAMDWVDGERLDGVLDGAGDRAEDLELLDLGIRCTLSQLLETGVLQCGNQPLVWGVPTKLQNSLAPSNRSRFG